MSVRMTDMDQIFEVRPANSNFIDFNSNTYKLIGVIFFFYNKEGYCSSH